jgi:hypothetical protein
MSDEHLDTRLFAFLGGGAMFALIALWISHPNK